LNLSKKIKSIIILFILLTQSLFSQELKKVTLQLSWLDQFQFAGYYMAKEKGFYFGLREV
jgi:ABC-type nitrate/sulfonate/bicarbonate transport system substrate-binding protein